MSAVQKIVILGGGTAGWLVANHIARKRQLNRSTDVRVALIESPGIPTVGVGEGTVPMMRQTLEYLGIRETDFIRQCDATFKQSVKFIDWFAPSDAQAAYYYHPFDYPNPTGFDATPYWLMDSVHSFAHTVGVQASLCDAGLGPKLLTHPEFSGPVSYAYHLDAAKFSQLLCEHAVSMGVEHIQSHVQAVTRLASGDIASLDTDSAGVIAGDLFIDCSGFRARLIEQEMGVQLDDKNHTLFVDHALAVQVPYASADADIPCSTLSTAQKAGWIWDIGLEKRRGVGYVYSSGHTTHDTAEIALRRYLDDDNGDLSLRRIPMKIGVRSQAWCGNCVAMGLAQGFVEPLEATGLLLFDVTARMLAEQLPTTRESMEPIASRFNQRIGHTWDKVIDFIKLHYCISNRSDSDFWCDNRALNTIPDGLQQNLDLWRHQMPTRYDFSSTIDIFNLENYLYVLYGMNFPTQPQTTQRFGQKQEYTNTVQKIEQVTAQMKAQLMPHRALIEQIKKHGLQRV
ncbi:tryptophan halogenase family protein [Echinimonas agarilytica]|uniref:Tryptophan 7-halogenase n=1 Tax=Echinimonas agarilytica TaxID=1215918 RepID=A0AA41W5J0_9GAMM|nr:tryptophan halogenase family protein [Echinimonas agarilytica]MCM2679040.1 tryptophan 7-halogenase [Echinimonas agarilytica]